jgi:signal transduction histidine kinase/CheY-like chemotaxis protein
VESLQVFTISTNVLYTYVMQGIVSNHWGGIFIIVVLTGLLVALILVSLKLRKDKFRLQSKLKQVEILNAEETKLYSKDGEYEKLKNQNIEIKEIKHLQKEELLTVKKELEQLKAHFHEQVLSKTSELHTSLEKTKESNRLKDAFLEKISREIRTPLNSILGFINLLNETNISKIDREYYLKFIRESGNSLLVLVDNIVDFSRLETGELNIEYKKCNLTLLLSELIDRYRTRFLREKSNLTLIYNKPETTKESLVDSKRVLHILDQLINNALKYTTDGKVEITYSISEDYHIFAISDTGVGIDQKYHDIIFESFYKIATDTQDVFQGAGLGLTIAKRITDLLEGTLTLNSKVGIGTTFTLKIPYKENILYVPQPASGDSNFDWSKKTILIAEDEDSNYFLLDAVLKKTNVNIIRADDGVKFLEIINKNKDIDLVLLDIKMPGINGFNAIKVIRQQNINIPVIAQTAFNQPEDKKRCLESGCNDYLAKPINKELLISKISNYFNA